MYKYILFGFFISANSFSTQTPQQQLNEYLDSLSTDQCRQLKSDTREQL